MKAVSRKVMVGLGGSSSEVEGLSTCLVQQERWPITTVSFLENVGAIELVSPVSLTSRRGLPEYQVLSQIKYT